MAGKLCACAISRVHSFLARAYSGIHSYRTRRQSRQHNKQLYDYLQGNHTELLRRSLLGQVRVYNNLEQHTVNAGSVKLFQRRVQLHLKDKARRKDAGWKASLTARLR